MRVRILRAPSLFLPKARLTCNGQWDIFDSGRQNDPLGLKLVVDAKDAVLDLLDSLDRVTMNEVCGRLLVGLDLSSGRGEKVERRRAVVGENVVHVRG